MKQNEDFNQTQRDLLAMAKLIGTRERWCQGPYARDTGGNTVGYEEPQAYSFCVYGSMLRITVEDDSAVRAHVRRSAVMVALDSAMPKRHDDRDHCPACFNDDPRTTHADVMALILRAVEQAKTEPRPTFWRCIRHRSSGR